MDSVTHLNDYMHRFGGVGEIDINYAKTPDDVKYISFKADGYESFRPGDNYFIDISKNGSTYPTCDLYSDYNRLGYYHSEIVISFMSGCTLNENGFFCLSGVWDESYRSSETQNMFPLMSILNKSGYYKFSFDQFNGLQIMRFIKYVPYTSTAMFGGQELLNSNSTKNFQYFSKISDMQIKNTTQYFRHLTGGVDSTINFGA